MLKRLRLQVKKLSRTPSRQGARLLRMEVRKEARSRPDAEVEQPVR